MVEFSTYIAPNKPYGLPALDWQYANAANASPIANTTPVVLRAASTNTAFKHYVSSIQYLNTSAVATEIVITDAASVVLWRGWAPAAMATMMQMTFPTPLQSTVTGAVSFAAITTAAAIYVSAQGFTQG